MSASDNVPSPVITVADGLANLAIQHHSPSPVPQHSPNSRPFIMYSRPQLLFLHKSPLVQLPNGMPALKDWFGTENDQSSSKKDSETPLPAGNARDRRFRRETDDAGSARQSFRGAAITQPSQMGNFKHQSIRAADRDRDRDAEKEQDRERVKEGQERLRNLSDKYDRDRRALSSLPQFRVKDRELAPHLANPSSRVTAQGHQAVSSRASDSRDTQKKKDGESNEDWRRDQPRTGRDRPENGRRDRDDRERPCSRVRDSSRSRREGSPSRRDKDDRRVDRDDGHSYRRDRDDRDRDFERDSEVEDPRRWRDDGKRDDRMAARREREIRERERESRDRRDRPTWDAGDRSDRRWVAGDDRDGRGKRSNGKDRKLGEDGKDRDDRKDREREKEPAWMDTYIPSNGSSGIIGSHPSGGELDGIQAFRKEMQQKDKSTSPVVASLVVSQTQTSPPSQAPENQLDEIQLFRLMMKREEEKKKSDSPVPSPPVHPSTEGASAGLHDDGSQVRISLEVGTNLTLTPALSSEGISYVSSPVEQHKVPVVVGVTADAPTPTASTPSQQTTTSLAFGGQESEITDKLTPQSSRLFSTTLSSDPSATAKPDRLLSTKLLKPILLGSRLLALGSRNPQNASVSSLRSTSSQSPASFTQRNGSVGVNAVVGAGVSQSIEPSSHFTSVVDTLRPNNGFSPFDEHRDVSALLNVPVPEATHRGSLTLAVDRTVFPADHALPAEPGLGGGFSNSHAVQSFEHVGPGIAAAKGSRFAKFFDGKGRDGQPTPFAKGSMGISGMSQPGPQKSDLPGLHPPHHSEARAMEDIFAMLNNSAQVSIDLIRQSKFSCLEQAQRLGVAPELPNLDIGYSSPSNNIHALQNAQGHPHLLGPGRVDSLYDDRNFVPDGMVPGLRSAPPPRSRQGSAMFSDFPDEAMQFNNGQRGPTQVYQGPVPSIHMQHGNIGRSVPISMQAAQFRGAPSPNHLASVQRLPPGLANLGGRPPHEPNQFVNASVGMTNGALHGTVHGNGPQPSFNNFQPPSLGFSGGPQIRPSHPGAHQLQGTLGPNALQGLVHPGNLGSSQAQLLGLAGANGVHGGLRGPGGGFGQQGPQVQPHIALRQQQPQQQIPPHMLPLHLQQQGFGGGATNQPAHDLMALLMNGGRRD
ncbi:hypothetical protein JVT61DRAFT_5739 [Boletus reticuloceps]|uniref:Uncharacterized protein n=1 Tax=Boletus reticuloceps TaxID=495285 RepID=A0A8I2Z058_9AGAM|nr:hypothetical protein JVT61DRAFT_5739 [Boletus reticuloceps]